MDAVESELVRLRGDRDTLDARVRAVTEALSSLNASLSELRDARRETSEAALRERERFSDELAAVNERCVEVRGIPELLRRYADAREQHAIQLRSMLVLTRGGGGGGSGSGEEGIEVDEEASCWTDEDEKVHIMVNAGEALTVRVRALLDVRDRKVAAAAERLRS